MAVQARVNPAFRAKWLLLAAAAFAFGLWCLYDATVAYPRHNQQIAAYFHFQSPRDRADSGLFNDAGEPTNWRPYNREADYSGYDDYSAYAETQGWSAERPDLKPKSSAEIVFQWVMLGIVWSVALICLTVVVWYGRRRVVADDTGITDHRGRHVPYDAFTSLDKQRWDAKGIAYAYFEQDGQQGRIKIDDWIFRDADLVLEELERRTGLGEPVPG